MRVSRGDQCDEFVADRGEEARRDHSIGDGRIRTAEAAQIRDRAR